MRGSILPLEPSARILAWQTVCWQLAELLGPRGYRGLQTVAPISSYRGIVGGIWCSHLPKLPGGVNNKPQRISQGFAARVTPSVFKKERKVVWACWGFAICHFTKLSWACVKKMVEHRVASHVRGKDLQRWGLWAAGASRWFPMSDSELKTSCLASYTVLTATQGGAYGLFYR